MWAFQIRILFKAKDLWKYVDGTITVQDVPDDQVDLWKEEDAKAQLYILLTSHKSVKQHLLGCATSKEMFDKLKTIYEKDTEHQKNHLLQELYTYKWCKSKMVLENISHVQQLAFQLTALGHEVNDTSVMSKITSILPKEYNPFATAWDSVPQGDKTLDNLCARLQTEESKLLSNKDESPVVFTAVTSHVRNITCHKCKKQGHYARDCRSRPFNGNRPEKCKYCKKTNHREAACLYKNGKYCHICKRTNHNTDDCRFNKNKKQEHRRESQRAHAQNAENSKDNDEAKSQQAKVCFLSFNKRGNEDENRNASETEVSDVDFTVDSGATGHMANEITIIDNQKPATINIQTAKKGDALASPFSGEINTEDCKLKQVNFVPGLSKNLLSVSRATTNGNASVIFTEDQVYFVKGQVNVPSELILLKGVRDADLYKVTLKCPLVNKNKQALYTETDLNNFVTWHRKMGHLGKNNLIKLQNLCSGIKFNIGLDEIKLVCTVCAESNALKLPHKSIRERASRPLELIHTDVGSVSPDTYDNKGYFLVILDDFTHFCAVYLMTHKSESSDFLKAFITKYENKLQNQTSTIRCDNGGEFISNELKSWCETKGITLDFTIPHCPQLNGKGERIIRTLLERTRALLNDSELPKNMWGEALRTAAYLINRSPTTTVEKLPIELWTKKTQDLSKIQMFGSVAYAKINSKVKKLKNRA